MNVEKEQINGKFQGLQESKTGRQSDTQLESFKNESMGLAKTITRTQAASQEKGDLRAAARAKLSPCQLSVPSSEWSGPVSGFGSIIMS